MDKKLEVTVDGVSFSDVFLNERQLDDVLRDEGVNPEQLSGSLPSKAILAYDNDAQTYGVAVLHGEDPASGYVRVWQLQDIAHKMRKGQRSFIVTIYKD